MAEVAPESLESLRTACDQCRLRKIRCDKSKAVAPCSHCRTGNRQCTFTHLGRKPREVKQRVSVSNRYECKIDHLVSRLTEIENKIGKVSSYLFSDIAPHATSLPTHTYHVSAVSGNILPSSNAHNGGAFEGSSSMTAQAMSAGEFVEQAVTGSSLRYQSKPDIQIALASLKQMVQTQNLKGVSQESMFANRKPIPKGGICELSMPPVSFVLKLLREIQATPPMAFITSCSFITIDYFIESCHKVFFPTEDYSMAVFIIVNAGLYYIINEKVVTEEPPNVEWLTYRRMCGDNIETALSSWPLLQYPNKETVEALLLGATYSIETSRFTLGYQLNSAAAATCQTLGWHRLENIDDNEDDTKLSIFWFCYMIDKGLALRFGRSSVIQDWDISSPRRFGNIHLAKPWKEMFNAWIETGSVLGEVYEKLYSAAAMNRQPDEQIQTAKELVERMKQQWKVLEQVSTAVRRNSDVVSDMEKGDGKSKLRRSMPLDMILKSGQVTHLASLTLIYRVIPNEPGSPGTLNAECIEAARMAFKCHEECMNLTSHSRYSTLEYLHWTILYAPFTPFTVLFCNVIETSNYEDLRRLDKFAASLQAVASISPAIDKFQNLCKVLYQVAVLYNEAKAQSLQHHVTTEVRNEFDTYFSQLGLIPDPHHVENLMAGNDFAQDDAHRPNMAPRLEDWFAGNMSIMCLMEEENLWVESRE